MFKRFNLERCRQRDMARGTCTIDAAVTRLPASRMDQIRHLLRADVGSPVRRLMLISVTLNKVLEV
jgi:hypothetical protein